MTAVVTPFRGDAVDYEAFARLVEHLQKQGSNAFLIAGSTGEGMMLSREEKVRLVQTAAETLGEKALLVGGVGLTDTAAALELARAYQEAGVDAVLVTTPPYVKPPLPGLVFHFQSIAEALEVPVILYNIPSRTGLNLRPEWIAEIAEHENIIGLKQANGSLTETMEVRRLVGEDFLIWSGDDLLTLPFLAVGAIGVVSVASHLIAGPLDEMIQAFHRGSVRKAERIHRRWLPLFRVLFVETNPVPVKWALHRLGLLPEDRVRPPLWTASEETQRKVEAVLRETGLLT